MFPQSVAMKYYVQEVVAMRGISCTGIEKCVLCNVYTWWNLGKAVGAVFPTGVPYTASGSYCTVVIS